MKPPSISSIEFIGGPEDGRVLDVDYLKTLFHGLDAKGADQIPMIERDLGSTEALYRVIGCYVACERKGKTLRYQWKWAGE